MHLEEYRKYRSTALKKLYGSRRIVELITPTPPADPRTLVYENIFPFAYVPDATTETKTFITMSLAVPRVQDKTYKSLTLTLYLFTHHSLLRTDQGLRFDLMAEEVDKLFNGSMEFGLGRLALYDVEDMLLPANYHGISLRYRIVDFNRKAVP